MNKKLVVTLASFILQIALAEATIGFSELMYDPEGADSGREWVEVRNDGDTVTLTNYKFFESNTNHSIVAFQGGNSIPSGGFAVIADTPSKFLVDFPDYKGLLFDSSFSLSNAGEFIALKDGSLATTDSLSYSPSLGGGDDGTTLSLLSGSWGRGEATPGAENKVSTKATSTSGGSASVSALASPPAPDLGVSLPEDLILVAGADKEFTGNALTSAGTAPPNMTYEWTFGDGGTRTGKTVLYHYAEPGYYMLVVEASNGLLFSKNRSKVKVIDADMKIHHVTKTDEKISIAISNNATSEVDVGTWKVDVGGLKYAIPKNTTLLPRTTTMLNGLELGMSTSTLKVATTSLVFPGGKILASSTYILGQEVASSSVENKKEELPKVQQRNNQQNTVQKRVTRRTDPVDEVVASSATPLTRTQRGEIKTKDKNIAIFLKKLWPF